jgi:phospholipid/cholesterol/gamma-HCH transport system substrate-binding protein
MKRSATFRNGVIIALFTVFCFAVMEYLAVNIGQPVPFTQSYSVNAVFTDADGVPTAADVRVAGVDVGKVTAISHDPSYPGETVVTMQITDSAAIPVYTDGYAMVRPKTLLGEKYIDLTVGNPNEADAIESGGFLPPAETGKDVENDEIFDAFDAPTRAEEQQVLQELDSAVFQRSGDIQHILPQLEQVVANLQPVTDVYERDQPQVDDIFVQLNTIMQTLADEHEQLAGVLSNGNVALGAIAAKDQALLATLQGASDVATEFNNAMAPTIAQQRQAIADLAPALESQDTFLNQVVGPQAACGGRSCGIDQVFTGTLQGNINYPNDQLTVTSAPGFRVTVEWDSMFSQPSNDNRALNLVLSFHCDAINQTLSGTGLTAIIQELEQITKQTIPLPNACTTLPGENR